MSLLINKCIYSILSTDNNLKSKVENKIYPLIANENTTFPFIVFKRSSFSTEYTKDGVLEDSTQVDIIVASDNYSDSIEIADIVRTSLELKKGTFNNINIKECKLSSADEDYLENTYIQTLSFTITTN
jgi:hypothetical protein